MESQNRTGIAVFLGLVAGFIGDLLMAAVSVHMGKHSAPTIGGLPFNVWGVLVLVVGAILLIVGLKWNKTTLIAIGVTLMSTTVWGVLFVFNPAGPIGS